jgi:hypothetical protein
MLYLKLNESNQIIICDQASGQIETMDCEYTVASVVGSEIKIWGTSDDRGLIDSTKFNFPSVSLPNSEDIEENQLASLVNDAVSFLEGQGCRVYKNDQQL